MTRNGATLAYVYDIDNRLTEIHQTTTGGALVNSYVYDDDGNLTAKKNSAGQVIQSLTYDAKGRANSINTSGVSQLTQLTYDPNDYRIGKADSTGSRTYLLEGEHLEGMLSGTAWQAKYLRGAVIDEIVNAYLYEGARQVNYTFHHDALQSVLGVSGHEGSVLQTISYGPFGEKIGSAGNANTNNLHYTGREEDPDTGLYNYRARLYDPGVGRFLSEDPLGFKAGVNFYAYVQNNPVNRNDPSGEFAHIVGGVVGGAIGGGTAGAIAGFMDTYIAELGNLSQAFEGAKTGFVTGAVVGAVAGGFTAAGLPQLAMSAGELAGSSILGQGFASGLFSGEIAAASSTAGSIAGLVGSALGPPVSPAAGSWNNSAAGGFVLYPNKQNTNMMRSIYAK